MNSTMDKKMGNQKIHWLLSSWTIFSSIVLGCFIGLVFKKFARQLDVFAEIFLSLLQMCVIPIIITAVVSSLAKIVTQRISTRFLSRLFLIFVCGLLFSSLVGVTAAFLGKPGVGMDANFHATIGQIILQYEIAAGHQEAAATTGLSGFLKGIVPSNIFYAVSKGQMLSILFFSICFGVALGLVRTSSGRVARLAIEALYDAFQVMFGWILYVLPFGLCILFASQISNSGLTIFTTMIKFIGVFYVTAFLMLIFFNTVIWLRRGGSFFGPLLALKDALAVGLGTASSYAAMPSTLRCLQQNLKVDKSTSNIVIPLGISLHQQGFVIYFAISFMFMAQLYQTPLGFTAILIIFFGAIFAALGSPAIPGPTPLVILALVLDPLGLPSETAMILLMAIDPIIDPLVTVVNIFGNCTAIILVEE